MLCDDVLRCISQQSEAAALVLSTIFSATPVAEVVKFELLKLT